MLDTLLLKVFAPLLDRLVRPGSGPVLSLVSFLITIGGAALIARHWVWLGFAVFALGCIGAAIAAREAPFAWAPVFEAVSFAAVPFALALHCPQQAVSLIFLLFGMMAAWAARLQFGRSLMGATELLISFVLLSIWPVAAYAAGVLCFVSAGASRIGGRQA